MSNEQQLVATLRRRLAIDVERVRRMREFAPSYMLIEIQDARAEIARHKAAAKRAGRPIADEPIDFS